MSDVKNQNDLLKKVLASVDHAVALVDNDLTFLNVWTNRKELFSVKANDLIGKKINTTLPEEISTPLSSAMREVLESGQAKTIEYSALNRSNSELFSCRISRLPHPAVHHTGFAVTLLIREVSLVKSERAKMVNASKLVALGEMASGIAHEINNPLAVIVGKASNLRSLLEKGVVNQDDSISVLKKIETTALRISKIIRGLQNISRNASNDPFTEHSLRSILDDAFELCRERFEKNEIQLLFQPNADGLIFCRPSQISQVLVNLLNNAFDAAYETPVEKKWVRFECNEAEDGYKILVSDCGLGISNDVKEKIFQPFFTTKEVGKGTGLGLSISRKIIEEHKGNLQIDEKSPNTCFIVNIPKAQRQKP